MAAIPGRVIVPCPWCGFDGADPVLTGRDHHTGEEGFTVARCRSCHLLYTRERPADSDLARFYPVEYYEDLAPAAAEAPSGSRSTLLHAVFGYPGGSERPFSQWLARAAAVATRRDASHVPWLAGGSLLEVGSGRGAVLARYRALGWNVMGVEPSPRGRELAQLAGLEVRAGTLEEQHLPPGSFDAVVLNHVLEHVPDPAALLLEVRRVLRPGGWLLTRVPNGESWEAHLYRERWWSWELPRHLTHFSPRTLRMVLSESGFEVVRLRTELRPTNLGLNARWATRERPWRRLSPRVAGALLLPFGALASWTRHGGDLAALARVAPTSPGQGSEHTSIAGGAAPTPSMAGVAE